VTSFRSKASSSPTLIFVFAAIESSVIRRRSRS
jgi:hypothetical protein